MENKNDNNANFTPSPLPKEFADVFELTKENSSGVDKWVLSGAIGTSDFTELFIVVDVKNDTCGKNERIIRVFNPNLDRWISENHLRTCCILDDDISNSTRDIAKYKFDCDCGRGSVFSIQCIETNRFFGLVTKYRFEIRLERDDRN